MKNGLYLIRDVVEGEGRHRLDIFWHLGPDMQRVEQNVFQGRDASQGLAILPAQGHNWEESFGTASWSPVYGQKALANVVHFSTIANVPAEFSTMLVALQEVHPSERSFSRIGGHGSETSVSVYQYSGEAGEYSFFFARSGEPWRHDTVSCDAEFLCWRGKTGDADQLFIACNGSYTKIEGGPELRCSRPVRWCSLHLEDGRWIACSSDPEAVEAPLDSILRRK